MKKFDKIIVNIQKELLELKEINQSLREENASLRGQLGLSVTNDNDDLSLEKVFNEISLTDDSNGKKTNTFSCCFRSGFHKIGDFRDKSIYDLIKIHGVGANACAILIILLEHYDIHIEIPDLESINDYNTGKTIKKIYEELPNFRERIVFKK